MAVGTPEEVAAAEEEVAQELLSQSEYSRDGFLNAIDELQELIQQLPGKCFARRAAAVRRPAPDR